MPDDAVHKSLQARACALLEAFAAVMNWTREATGLASMEADVAEMLSLRSIALIVQERLLAIPHGDPGFFLDLASIPDPLLHPLRCYPGETGGYDLNLPPEGRRSDQPLKLHDFTLWSLSEARSGCAA